MRALSPIFLFLRRIGITLALILSFSATTLKANEIVGENSIVVYGTSWCPYCNKVRDYLQSLGINFTDYDIETSELGKQKYNALHGQGVPIIIIGSQRIDGFDRKALEQALQTYGLLNNA